MLKRKIFDDLIKWKEHQNKKCLIVTGMRQIGKTFIIKEFGKKCYKNFIYINFIMNDKYKLIFDEELNIDKILQKIKYFEEFKNIDLNEECLLFLDEIQECPQAIVALKELTTSKKIHTIASGSYFGIKYKQRISFPVGYVSFLTMKPLDFEEFLWAMEVNQNIIDELKSSFINNTKVSDVLHNLMIELFSKYIIIGGMPDVINSYIQNKDFFIARKVQKDIVQSFIYDISKYASINEVQKILESFNSIPMQLAKENKKFMFSKIKKNARSLWYYGSIQWLIDSNIVNKCNSITQIKQPLNGFENNDDFKIYMNDTGLLLSMLDDSIVNIIINNQDSTYKGGIYENVVSQILSANGYKLRYFTRNNTLEIDFVIEKNDVLIPIEVKAGNNKSKSLITILNENPDLIGYKLTNENISIKKQYIKLPWYMLFLI